MFVVFLDTLDKIRSLWDKSEKLLKEGVSYRKKILNRKISGSMWKTFAKYKLNPKRRKNLPKFEGIDDKGFRVMLIPQKLYMKIKRAVACR